MRQVSWLRLLVGLTLILLLAGCETFSFPLKSKAVIPPLPEGESGAAGSGTTAPAPGSPGAAAAPAPRPDLSQQVQALEARVQQLESRLAAVERQPTPPPQPVSGARRETPGTKERPATAAGPPKALASAADKYYNEGSRLYQGKKYSAAREKFYQYLKDQPQGPKAPEARYHLADSFYQEGKYKEAAVEFNKLATQFPKSILAPSALLRQALAYKNLDQTQNYHNTLKKLGQTYPQSPEAKEAQNRLKESKKEGN